MRKHHRFLGQIEESPRIERIVVGGTSVLVTGVDDVPEVIKMVQGRIRERCGIGCPLMPQLGFIEQWEGIDTINVNAKPYVASLVSMAGPFVSVATPLQRQRAFYSF
jgi:hypothetical protein